MSSLKLAISTISYKTVLRSQIVFLPRAFLGHLVVSERFTLAGYFEFGAELHASGAAAPVDLHVGEPAEDDVHVLAEVEHADAAHLLRGAARLALRLKTS